MNEKVKVSVIIPSLNVSVYISQCLDSVINQSLHAIEVICVDAGSDDGTLDMLREYEKRDSRVKVVVSEKRSYGYQMNLGINLAQGEYIGIVEADDFISLQMYEELYQVAKENGVDFVKADFYRFWTKNEKLNKLLYSVIGNASFYNRVIYTEKEKGYFWSSISNTWCGIYNRKFLLDNQICHNESPGASFQDNGFCFLVYAFAQRGYFVNKPYYMNRRDNPNSSVFSRHKSFCMCDEYEFIENKLKRDERVFEANKFILAYMSYRAHDVNLNRVSDENMEKYMKKFSDTLRRFDKQGLLNRDMFSKRDWDNAGRIIEDPMQYYRTEIMPQRQFFHKIGEYDSIIIYGAGKAGQRFFGMLYNNMLQGKVHCFAVTHTENNAASYMGLPINDIHDLVGYRNKAVVVIAEEERCHKDMLATLKELEFDHVFIIPD